MRDKKDVLVSLRLSRSIWQVIKQLAEERDISMAMVIREALAFYLAKKSNRVQ